MQSEAFRLGSLVLREVDVDERAIVAIAGLAARLVQLAFLRCTFHKIRPKHAALVARCTRIRALAFVECAGVPEHFLEAAAPLAPALCKLTFVGTPASDTLWSLPLAALQCLAIEDVPAAGHAARSVARILQRCAPRLEAVSLRGTFKSSVAFGEFWAEVRSLSLPALCVLDLAHAGLGPLGSVLWRDLAAIAPALVLLGLAGCEIAPAAKSGCRAISSTAARPQPVPRAVWDGLPWIDTLSGRVLPHPHPRPVDNRKRRAD